MSNYDVIIIGGGPAGLTASIYARRRELKVLVIAKAVGGQAALAHEVQNWPGTESTTGLELTQRMKVQAEKWGVEFVSDEVQSVTENSGVFIVKTAQTEYQAAAVILAFGLTPRDLGVPQEKELTGRGVSYCATCDGPLFKNKTVAVIGGGNSASEAAEYLSRLVRQVYLLSDSCNAAADAALVEEVKALKNVQVICGLKVTAVVGSDKVAGLKYNDLQTNEEKELAVDGIFVEIGFSPRTDWIKDTVKLNERKEIITDKVGATSQPGIFAAGDCTDVGFKQMTIAAGEGAKAALSAYKYLAAKKGKVATPDWGVKK
ncbi:MAG: FAD-dependent oxidoreductase [Candidatus Buchananbacteria bacterium]